jgi:hypothetical protein
MSFVCKLHSGSWISIWKFIDEYKSGLKVNKKPSS